MHSTGFLSASDNPVAIERVTTLAYRFQEQGWTANLERLKKLNYRAAIVGIQGSGKSTLLRDLKSKLDKDQIDAHHVFLPRSNQHHRNLLSDALQRSESGGVLLVDGIERLSFLQRRKLFRSTRQSQGLVIATHVSCQLPTWIRCRTTPELLSSLLTELGLNEDEIQTAGFAAFQKSGGNLRLALFDLYDQFSSGKFNRILSL